MPVISLIKLVKYVDTGRKRWYYNSEHKFGKMLYKLNKCYTTVTKCKLFVIEKIVYGWYNMERRPQDVVVAINKKIFAEKDAMQ